MSTFWQHLFKAQGKTLNFSLSYHPQTDGQTEVLNRGFEAYLRCFVGNQPKKWYQYLNLAELWQNTTYHSAIGTSLFHALYGRQPPTIVDVVNIPNAGTTIQEMLMEHIVIVHVLREHLRRARQRIGDQANRHRIDRSFDADEWVWVRLHPYRQHSLTRCPNQKLGSRYIGPYRVLRRVGVVAYKLQLPESAHVHPVFHVSLLRPFKGSVGEPIFPATESIDFSLPSTLNSTENPSQKYMNSPDMETNAHTPGVPLTAGTNLPNLEPHAHAPQKSPSTSHNDLNTPPARAHRPRATRPTCRRCGCPKPRAQHQHSKRTNHF